MRGRSTERTTPAIPISSTSVLPAARLSGIESIFPTQTPRELPPGADQTIPVDEEEAAKRKAQQAEAEKDVMYWALAIFATLGVITAMMVRSALHDWSVRLTNTIGWRRLVLRCPLRPRLCKVETNNSSGICLHEYL